MDVPANHSCAVCVCVGVSLSAGLPSWWPLLLCQQNDGKQGSV
jgi:hypothetical protein